ncbi:MAG: GntR family transcriptional regulator [Chloroflexi bacterium]|nr:MAG: GntR family transcriptional regulator [Chloroflexota bacterium]
MAEIAHGSLTDKVGDEIARLISTRALQPGARIRQVQLAEQLGTSRVPVREALRELGERGLVDYRARRGYRVSTLTLKSAEDVFATRLALERLVVEQVVKRSDQTAAIDQLGDTLEAMSSAVHRRDVSTVIEVDLGFHRALAALADNKILDKVYHLVTERVRPALALMVPDELHDELVEQHRHILQAVTKRDLVAADEALRAHNAYAVALLRTLLIRQSRT